MLCTYLREGTHSLKGGSYRFALILTWGIRRSVQSPSLDPSFKDVFVSFTVI